MLAATAGRRAVAEPRHRRGEAERRGLLPREHACQPPPLPPPSKPVDELSVTEALVQRNEIDGAGGKHYVSELAAKVPVAGYAKHYAEIVQQNSLLRRLLGAGQEIQGWVHERDGEPRELSERAEKLLFDVAHNSRRAVSGCSPRSSMTRSTGWRSSRPASSS